MSGPSIGSWTDVERLLAQRPPGTWLRIPKGWLGHPKTQGMKPSCCLPLGQRGDFWKRLDDGRSLLVQSFGAYYLATLEPVAGEESSPSLRRSPSDPLEAAVALGALLGTALGRSEGSLMAGAAFGGLVSTMLANHRR